MLIWHNGSFIEDTNGILTARDRVRLGDGVFDTMLCTDGRPAYPDLHFARLMSHAVLLRIPVDFSARDLSATAKDLLTRNAMDTGRCAITTLITHGPSQRGLMPPENAQPQIVISATPIPDTFAPIHAITAQTVRRNEGSPLSQIKSCNYGDNILAMLEAGDKGANEALLLNNAGNAACFTIGNLFIVQDGALYTPPLFDGAMDGIVRRLVIAQYGAKEKSMTPGDIAKAQGIYLTNSIRGAQAVATLNGKTLSAPEIRIDPAIHLS